MKLRWTTAGPLALGALSFLSAACGGGATAQTALGGSSAPPPQILGAALPDLAPAEQQKFLEGLVAFSKVEDAEDGLGPVFNATSCADCHRQGAIGGASSDDTLSRVTRIGGIVNGTYSDLTDVGGPVLEARSLQEFDPTYPYAGEVVPPGTPYVSHRMTTPIFGDGLIESIPESVILNQASMPKPDGIHGVPNWVLNPETGVKEIGRFGWKASVSSLHVFAGDAYLNEMGITSAFFPHDNVPQGSVNGAGADSADDPEDNDGDVDKFADYMRLLAPPRPRPNGPITLHGRDVFHQIRCGACHTPELQTGPNAIAALSDKTVHLFSDLLLHQMGPQLADGIVQGQAQGDQFKTAPLWGLAGRKFFLHDGRARTIEEAIALHGGEASMAKTRFLNLPPPDKAALLDFLSRL